MSASDTVRASLESIGFVQLLLLFATLIAYGLALSEAFPARVRGAAAAAALVAAGGFSAATPAVADGVVLLALAVALVGGFAAAAWLLARGLGLETRRGVRSAETAEARRPPAAHEVVSALPGRTATRPS